jgi:AcrR family transcriptional regulator
MGRPKKVPGVDPPARREQILDAAIRLFAEKGIAGTSTKDIADAVKLTKSMVHYYFSSKADLVVDAQERAYRRYQERVRAKVLVGGTSSPRRRAVDSLRDLWDAVNADPELQKIQIQA